jgi:ankyrin repeat protein
MSFGSKSRKNRSTEIRWVAVSSISLAWVILACGAFAVHKLLLERKLVAEMEPASSKKQDPDRNVVLRLIRSGASPNAVAGRAWTPLDYAVWNDDQPLIRELLARGADPNQRLAGGQVALVHVYSEAASEMLASRGANVDYRSGYLDEPLAYSLIAGRCRLDALRPLMARGLDLNASNARGKTGLMELAYKVRVERLQELLDLGADPTLRDRNGFTARDHAAGRLRQETSSSTRARLRKIMNFLDRKADKR